MSIDDGESGDDAHVPKQVDHIEMEDDKEENPGEDVLHTPSDRKEEPLERRKGLGEGERGGLTAAMKLFFCS